MGRGRLEVLVDNAWRTHVGRRGGEGCYDTYRSVLYRDPRASPWPLRVTGVSYARARQRPGGLTVSPHARFGTASGGGRKCGEKRRGVGRRAAPRTAGHPSRGRDTCGSEGQPPATGPRALATRRWSMCSGHRCFPVARPQCENPHSVGSCSAPCCDPGIRVCVGDALPQPHGYMLSRAEHVAIKERLSDSKALRNAWVTTPCTRPATVDHLVNMCHRAREPSPMARE